jgi:hypothetical protein
VVRFSAGLAAAALVVAAALAHEATALAEPTPARLALGASIHRSARAGCHDAPGDANSKLPARDLFRLAADGVAGRLRSTLRQPTSSL